MEYSIETIENMVERGERPKYLMFWGHQPNRDGTVGSSCFSQWWLSEFKKDGLTFYSAEQWMMWKKANLFQDIVKAEEILICKKPAEAKALGRKVKGFVADVWDEYKYEIVKEGNFLKFSQNSDLTEYLMNTKKRVLVEASPVDPIWGIGLARDHENAEKPSKWRGQNLLGFALMEVRDKLVKFNLEKNVV